MRRFLLTKAEETTKSVHNCLKIAENIRKDATKTLVTLHHQGEQIPRTHQFVDDFDRDLSREPTAALEKVEFEKEKQDDALSNLSDLLGELKDMAIDMGSEIQRQNKPMSHLEDHVDELDFRMKGAIQRQRRFLEKLD
ncbi:SNAP25 ous protein [Trifolium repens]|nr:SNAP25 ous protein [Trifolium repens]